MSEDHTTPEGQPASSRHGGRRPGAGRKRNEQPVLYMQISMRLNVTELAMVHALTPLQRRDLLLPGNSPQASQLDVTPLSGNDHVVQVKRVRGAPLSEESKFYVIRLELRNPSDYDDILALNPKERKRRLLEEYI